MPTLNCLRGVAILAVVVYHGFCNVDGIYAEHLRTWQFDCFALVKWGRLGVQLFFVLSGFLITGILLDTRASTTYYQKFYERRALRILPAFVLLNVVLLHLHRTNLHYAAMALFFLANLHMSSSNPLIYAPFWSLAVEEQFYIVWPTLLRVLRPRTSFFFALGLLIMSPLLRFGALHVRSLSDVVYKPWGVLGFFGGGAAIAGLIRSSRSRSHLWRILGVLAAATVISFAVYVLVFPKGDEGSFSSKAWFSTPWTLLFSTLVLGAFLLPRLASTRPGRALAFLGYISYGLYLVHPLIQFLIEERWEIPLVGQHGVVLPLLGRFLVCATISTLIAWLSRSTFEAYFLRLKPKQRKVALDVPIVV